MLQLVSGHRGQILGYEGKPDWKGWDAVSVYLPIAEMQDLIVELRSQTMGVGFFNWEFDRLQEVPEPLAKIGRTNGIRVYTNDVRAREGLKKNA